MQHGSRKDFSGGSQKIIGVYIWRLERRVAMRRELVWGRQRPVGGPGGKAPGKFSTLLPSFEHSDLIKSLIHWSITFEVGGSWR